MKRDDSKTTTMKELAKQRVKLEYTPDSARYGIGIVTAVLSSIVLILKTTNTEFHWQFWLILVLGMGAVVLIGWEWYDKGIKIKKIKLDICTMDNYCNDIKIENISDKTYYEIRLGELVKKELDLRCDAPSVLNFSILALTVAIFTVHTWQATSKAQDIYTQISMASIGLGTLTIIISVMIYWIRSSHCRLEIETEIAVTRKAIAIFIKTHSAQAE
jgi:hypothetical protein